MSSSASSTNQGRSNPSGAPATRYRSCGTSGSRLATRSRTTSNEKSATFDGSQITRPPMCMCQPDVSANQNAASTLESRFMPTTQPPPDERADDLCGHVKNPSDLRLSYCYYISYNSNASRAGEDVPSLVELRWRPGEHEAELVARFPLHDVEQHGYPWQFVCREVRLGQTRSGWLKRDGNTGPMRDAPSAGTAAARTGHLTPSGRPTSSCAAVG